MTYVKLLRIQLIMRIKQLGGNSFLVYINRHEFINTLCREKLLKRQLDRTAACFRLWLIILFFEFAGY